MIQHELHELKRIIANVLRPPPIYIIQLLQFV